MLTQNPGWRRQFRYSVLRWQARLDTQGSDRVLPWVYATMLFTMLVLLSLARYRSLENGADLSRFLQGAWLIGEGRSPRSALSGEHLFSGQVPLIFWPLAQVSRLSFIPTAPLLLVVQSFAISCSVVPIFLIARRVCNLRVGAASAIVLAFALYPAAQDLNLADFHPEALAIAPMIAMCLAAFRDRWLRFAIFAVLVVACRADFGFAIAGFGLLLAIRGERRIGAAAFVGGAAWTILAVTVIHPQLSTSSNVEYLGAYGDSVGGVVWGMLTNPVEVLSEVFSRDNFDSLVRLFAPLLFLPLVAPRYFLPIVPLQLVYLAAAVPEGPYGNPQLEVPATAFLFVAACFGMAKIGTLGVERITVNRRILGAFILTGLVFFARDAASTPYEEPWNWYARSSTDQARLAAIEFIPDDASVQASPNALSLLAEREAVYLLDTASTVVAAERTLVGADYVLFDRDATADWSSVWLTNFDRNIRDDGRYEPVYFASGITLYRRTGAPVVAT